MHKEQRARLRDCARRLDRRRGFFQFGWVVIDPYDNDEIVNRVGRFPYGYFKKSIQVRAGRFAGKYLALVESNLFPYRAIGEKIHVYEVDLNLNVKRLT